MDLQSRNELPAFFKRQGYKVGAEIGVYKGEFTKLLCEEGLKIYAVDPWITYKDYRKHPHEEPYEKLYEDTVKRLEPYDVVILRKTSMEALEDVKDESLDFVYIDGNHSLPYVCQDIYEWNRKVRKGGIISGHDYFNSTHNPYWIRICHVKYAVDICAEIFGAELHIIGRKDKCPSWLWIKQ